MTESIANIARQAARPGTEILPVTPSFGPESAEGYYESFVAAAAMLDAVERHEGEFDAIIAAGFGEHGREGLRQRWNAPVVDITEAAAMAANLVSRRYGVVTSLRGAIPGIWDSLTTAGLHTRCVDVRASGIPVASIHSDPATVADTLEAEARTVMERGGEAVVLGCAGFAGLSMELTRRLGVPVIDGVDAAVRFAEALVTAGLSTSKIGAFRQPDGEKQWTSWSFPPAQAPADAMP
ncbi:Asp/Glu/hydantoin racemase [Microbacterium barkeri]